MLFRSLPHNSSNDSSIENDLLKSTEIFLKYIDEYSDNGSGWSLAAIRGFILNVSTYKPLRGKSYIELPEYYKNKRCIINVKNKDNKCFAYALTSGLYPVKQHSDRPPSYDDHFTEVESKLLEIGVEYPVAINDNFLKR